MPIFDVLDGPMHASLRHAVRDHRLRGWSLTLIGLGGLVALFVTSESPVLEAASALVFAALFGAFLWWLECRDLPAALTSPPAATDSATIEPGRPLRVLTGAVPFAALMAACFAFDFATPPVGIALGFGVVELGTARALHRWERRTGRTILSVGSRLRPGDLFAR